MKKMQRLCLLIFFVLTSTGVLAQNRQIDSLKSALALSGKPDDFKILWRLAYELTDLDNNQAFKYAELSYKSSMKAGDSLYIVKSGRIMGLLFRYLDRLDESISMLNASLAIAQRNNLTKEVYVICNLLANGYSFRAEYDKALEYNFKALVFQEEEKDTMRIGITLMNIGFVYYRMGSDVEALDYFERALKIKIRSKDKFDLDKLYSNIGFCHNDIGNYKEARNYFNKAIKICEPNCQEETVISIEMGLAKTFFLEKDYPRAEFHYLKSLDFSKKDNDQRFQIEISKDLIELYLLRNDLSRTGNYFKYVESLPEFGQYAAYNVEFYKLKAEYYTRLRNFKLANSFQKKYSDAMELERGNERSLSLVKVKAQFIERENIARIKAQKEKLALQEQALSQQRLLNLLIGAVVILTIAIIIILVRANREKELVNELLNRRVKERTVELEKNRDELEHTHSEQAIILKRVSSDLVASLATIKGLSDIANAELPEQDAMFFKKAESMTEKMVDYMRHYSNTK